MHKAAQGFNMLSGLFSRNSRKIGAVELVKDPTCGMAVDPSNAYYTEVGRGKRYYFCGAGCKATFKKAINKTLSSMPREVRKASKGGAECCH